MRAHGLNVGGEQSGHIVLSDFSTTGDGLVSALQVLACIKRQNKPVSELSKKFEPVPQLLKNVRFSGGKPLEEAPVKAAIEDARNRLGKAGRLVIRPSGTEPLIRVMAEGDDPQLVETRGQRHRRRHFRDAQRRLIALRSRRRGANCRLKTLQGPPPGGLFVFGLGIPASAGGTCFV